MSRSPVAPFIAPLGGSVNQRLAQIATALSKKADATAEPSYAAVLLRAPGGATYRLSVDDTGALTTAVVTRT